MSPKATVYVVDDDASIRRSLSRLLVSAGYAPQTFASSVQFLTVKRDPGPACLILDLQLAESTGLEVQNALAGSERQLPIIFISGHGDIPTSVSAMKAGAIDFLTKPFDSERLLETVGRALIRDADRRKNYAARRSIELRRERLTSRENQVLTLVVNGRLNKQIALKLGISEKTVKVHRARVMEKMRAGSLAELVRLDNHFRTPALK